MKSLTKAGVTFDRILDTLMFLGCVIFAVAMLFICVDVVMRYALNRPIIWVLELCEYSLVGIVSFGMAWLLKQEGHIKVDFLLERFKPRTQALVNAVTSAFGAVAVLTVSWYGGRNTFSLTQSGVEERGTLGISIAVLLIPLAIGCFLLFIQLVRRSYSYMKSFSANKGGL